MSVLRLRISLGFSNWRPARPSCTDKNTLEVPGKVDRQDYGQRQQANHGHEQDDVALEGQVRDGVDATFATDLFIPADTERGNFKNLLIPRPRSPELSILHDKSQMPFHTCRCDVNQSSAILIYHTVCMQLCLLPRQID